MDGAMVGWPLSKLMPVGRSGGRTPRTPIHFNKQTNCQYRGATWQPMIGPRGTLPFAKMMPRVTNRFVQLSSNHKPPCQQVPTQLYHIII